MENNSFKYSQYVTDCKLLARSLSIYYSISAELLNTYVVSVAGSNGLNNNRPETWKYHLNLCGEYHPLDTPIMVKSLDTMESIVFNKANLAVHRATKDHYKFGSVAHEELLSAYPGRTLLINGVICPAKMSDVLNAEDGEIVAYDASLVEEHERTLISRLNVWTKTQHLARYNRQYALVHDFAHSVHVASMQLNAFKQITNLRLESCRSGEAHSYHIWAHLASNGKLHRFMPYMTRYQQLWLYRNIEYIHNHCGLQDTYEWLTENLLTVRGIPLAAYQMNHILDKQPNELKPDIGYVRLPRNNISAAKVELPRTLEAMMRLEDPVARGNPLVRDWYLDTTYQALQNTRNSTMNTKVLESAMVDTSNSFPYRLVDVLLNEWAHLSSIDYYTAYVLVDHPIAGEKFYLSAKDAFILLWYAFNKSRGKTLEYIEDVHVARVSMVPKTSITGIKERVKGTVVNDYDLARIDVLPEVTPQISVLGFYELCQELWKQENVQFYKVAEYNTATRRAHAEYAVSQFFFYGFAELQTAKTTYTEWFSKLNIRLTEPTDQADWEKFYQTLFVSGTGLEDKETTSMKNVQRAMIAMMRQLSSYTIQFIEEFTGEDTVPLNFLYPRHGISNWKSVSGSYCDFGAYIDNVKSKTKNTVEISDGGSKDTFDVFTTSDVTVNFGVNIGCTIQPSADVYSVDMGTDIIYTRDDQGSLANWSAERMYSYAKTMGHCPYPMDDTRPSAYDIFTVNDVADMSDLHYPPS